MAAMTTSGLKVSTSVKAKMLAYRKAIECLTKRWMFDYIKKDEFNFGQNLSTNLVKNLGGNLPEKQFTIIKRSFRSSTKPLSLDSTILLNELTEETFYRFRTSKLFNK